MRRPRPSRRPSVSIRRGRSCSRRGRRPDVSPRTGSTVRPVRWPRWTFTRSGSGQRRSSRFISAADAPWEFAHASEAAGSEGVARAGSGPLHLALCAEYDCLPGIGHACGHNLIAAMAVGAGIAAAQVADDLGVTIRVIGTPAEELGGGGKILLLERGAFAGAHAAMMVHPSPVDSVAPLMLANAHFSVRYTGKEAHASAYPELGVNAADALTVAQVAIGLLRQHIHPTDRVHGIVTKGGEAPNIIPAQTTARYIVRAKTLDDLDAIRAKVLRCFEAGALATGTQLEIFGSRPPYAQVRHDPAMAALYRHNA